MMNQQNDFNYYSVSDYQALQVPYGSGNFSMLIILPNTGIDINYLLNELNGALLNRINAGMAMQLVTLVLPRFQVSYCDSLKSPLIDLGMVNAFNPSLADFSYINPMLQLYISNVIHKTYVKVGEQGTEAAAATAVVMGTSCAGPTNPRLVFNVDHPFIFFIIEKNSGAILFAGKIVNPLN
jgi:serpin B